MIRTSTDIALVLALLLSPPARSWVAADKSLTGLRVQDLGGQPERFLFGDEVKAVVFLFVSVECPISNSYAPEMRRLAREFGPKNVLFKLVYPNLDETAQSIQQHLKDFGLSLPALRDPQHDLVKAAEVAITPEAAIFLPKLGFAYHGRIDNRYAALGLARPEATEHDLRDALISVLQGKPPPHRVLPAVGCSIAPLPPAAHHH